MKITILNTLKLEHVPSGSGIAKYGDTYYVVGDDSPFLFALDKQFKIISKTRLVDSDNPADERIIKSKKPDFEAMEMIGENELIIFGSGSLSPQRDVFIRILIQESMRIEKYDITELYTNLKNLTIFKDSELNIEGVAYHNKHIFLFNRKKNLIIQFEYDELLKYIKGEVAFPQPDITEFTLPKIDGIESGFSGATTLNGESKIIFTASVENTDNAYDDGEIIGSLIGMIDIRSNKAASDFEYCLIPNNEEKLKVESVTIAEEIEHGKTKIVLVTDDDLGNSILLEGMLDW